MISLNDLSAVDQHNLRTFAFWGTIAILKVLIMVPLTARMRFVKKVFISSEDTALTEGAKVVRDDEDIERIRRAHQNDLENILPWAISTVLWLTTSPNPLLVSILIKTFCTARIIHTIVYAVYVIRQPARAMAFFVGYFIILYQCFATLYHYIYYF